MSFLTENKIKDEFLDDIDDDLDDDLDDIEVIKPSEEQLAEADELDKKLKGLDKKEMTREEKRAALRRQIAEKRNNRGVGRQVMTTRSCNPKKQMAQAMNIPGMKDMMDTMMKGDNIEKLLQSSGTTGINAAKLKQALGTARK